MTTTGMNCTAWNSVRAKAETNSPIAVPSTASATATTTSIHPGPVTSRPRTNTLSSTASSDCTAATRPNASA